MEPKLAQSLAKIARPAVSFLILFGACWVGFGATRHTSAHASWATLTASIGNAEPRSGLAPLSDKASEAARLERTAEPDGAQSLQGETRFELPGARASLRVAETAHIGPSGRLDRAEVDLAYAFTEPGAGIDGQAVVHELFDASGGAISIVHANGARETRAAENQLPWIYLPVRLPSGAWASTPIAVSVARAAARSGKVALEVAAGAADLSITADQFDVTGGSQEWLLLGDDLATFAAEQGERGALLSLKIGALGVTFQAPLELGPQWAASSAP